MTYTKQNKLLSLQDINLSYDGKKVLRDINIDVCDIIGQTVTGQVVTLLGKSGVGKTRLMSIIAGLERPTSGMVLVGEEQRPVEPGIVGMVLQNYPLFGHRTLKRNLELVSNDKAKIDFYLQEFDLSDKQDNYPSQLSGGQRQRTAIVQQLLCSEHFVLLDEPFSGLDPVATEKLCKNISKIANLDEKNTIIISTHILEPAMAISDAVWMIGHEYIDNYTNDGLEESHKHKIEGATIVHTEDLAAQGLAWNPNIRRDRKFIDLVEKIREKFQTI